jgi:1-acyl-sn-glycerol-3-phosphate acyltransferase
LIHVLINLPLTMLCLSFPLRKLSIKGIGLGQHAQALWSAGSCRIFGLKRRVTGRFVDGPALVAANHISWVDIQLLHSITAMGFVAKAEIQRWPVAGWVAGFGETVFHHRGSHDSASSVLSVMCERLESGRKVAIFPEGGILAGEGVKKFHARLFAAAIETQAPVQAVMIRYLKKGKLYPQITFAPGEHFLANFFRLLRQPACIAEVVILDAISPLGRQRRSLADEAQAVVTAAYNEPAQP